MEQMNTFVNKTKNSLNSSGESELREKQKN